MGTYYRVKAYGNLDKKTEFKNSIEKFFKLFNNVFSTYIKDSEISKINYSKFDNNEVSDSLLKVINLSQEISKKSSGYFDITVAPLVNAWGFGPGGKQRKPTPLELKGILESVGYSKIKIKKDRLYMPVKMELDLSAIAKGYGVDELVKFLEYKGYNNLLVEIGGEVRTRGLKVDGSNWKVGIEGPSLELGNKIVKVVSLKNMSMATSGSYRNYVKYGSELFNHTINPISGNPITHKTISVTVLSEYCSDADAWATALMSMGEKKGLDLANKQDLMVYFQVQDGEEVKSTTSRAFDKYIKSFKEL